MAYPHTEGGRLKRRFKLVTTLKQTLAVLI